MGEERIDFITAQADRSLSSRPMLADSPEPGVGSGSGCHPAPGAVDSEEECRGDVQVVGTQPKS